MSESSETFRVVWGGDSETDCVEACRELQLAAIEYRVSQQPVSRSSRMGVIWKFEVMVLGSDYELAKEALGLGEDGNEAKELEFEIEENVSSINQKTPPQNQQKAPSSYLRRWRPDDANVEVWSQKASEPSIVELSLTENLIHFRLERVKNGTLKYFVLPDDEYRAREILREIKNGDPPK